MKIVQDRGTEFIVFGSGRRRSANCAIIGLRADDLDSVYGGYDEQVWGENDRDADADYRVPEDRLTKEDLAELADYMVERWLAFKARWAV